MKHLQSAQAEKSQFASQPAVAADRINSNEFQELKELNAQLIERFSRERGNHAKTTKELEKALDERVQLASRLDAMSRQLYDLATINDDLNCQLAAARSPSKQACPNFAAVDNQSGSSA